MRDMEHMPPYSLGDPVDPETPQRSRVYTGPDTSSQLLALRKLKCIAAGQHPNSRPTVPQGLSARPPTPSLERTRRRRKAEQGLTSVGILRQHVKRLTSFSVIGGGVFFAGLFLQIALVRYCGFGPNSSYAVQALFSIELSYLLNRYLTWHDQDSGFWVACWKFNVQKLLMTVANMAAYALLVHFGMQYVVANVLLTAIFTPINYFAAHLLVFVRSYTGKRRKGGSSDPREFRAGAVRLPAVQPSVSVIIPCKSSEKTIRATVTALLDQDYPALREVILVGDVNDSTFTAVQDVADRRLILLEQEKTPGRRDPNVKRDKGIQCSAGEVLALADSDIVMDRDWLSRAISLLNAQGGGLVAGGMRSIHNTFWGRFVDSNMLAAKTPRLSCPYCVTADNFGKRGFKPPVTANAVFTRDLYEVCPLDVTWAYGYEDYEWFWRLAREGHAILFSGDLTAAHHHRRSFKLLVREYRQAAHGCAQFVRTHPDSPLARKRTQQAFALPLLALMGLITGAAAVISGYTVELAGLLCVASLAVCIREAVGSRSLEGLIYVPAAFALGGIFVWSLARNLMLGTPQDRSAPTWMSTTTAFNVTALDVLEDERLSNGVSQWTHRTT